MAKKVSTDKQEKKDSRKKGLEIRSVDFSDDVKLEKKDRRIDLFSLISLLVIFAIVFGVLSLISIQKIPKHLENITAMVNKTVYYYSPKAIDLSEHLEITDAYYTKNVVLIGFLQQEITYLNADTRSINKYIVDDNNKKIKLLLGYYASRDYDKLFVNTTKDKLYVVEGLLRKSGSDLVLNVNNINPTERPTDNTSSIEEVEDSVQIIVPEKTIMNYSHGMKRAACLFTC
jgi:hypothetical protein